MMDWNSDMFIRSHRADKENVTTGLAETKAGLTALISSAAHILKGMINKLFKYKLPVRLVTYF
jgi:hypothetical protein